MGGRYGLTLPSLLLALALAFQQFIHPPGMTFPLLIDHGGEQDEGFIPGTWKSCDSLPLYRTPGDTTMRLGWVLRNEQFAARGRADFTRQPGAVRVTSSFRRRVGDSVMTFAPGDTLYILGGGSEGVFDAWFKGVRGSVDFVWPYDGARPSALRGELIQQMRRERWVLLRRSDGLSAWARQDGKQIKDVRELSLGDAQCANRAQMPVTNFR
jgi:hypothetical protein